MSDDDHRDASIVAALDQLRVDLGERLEALDGRLVQMRAAVMERIDRLQDALTGPWPAWVVPQSEIQGPRADHLDRAFLALRSGIIETACAVLNRADRRAGYAALQEAPAFSTAPQPAQ